MNPILAVVLFVIVAVIAIVIAAKLIVVALLLAGAVLVYFGAEKLIGKGSGRARLRSRDGNR